MRLYSFTLLSSLERLIWQTWTSHPSFHDGLEAVALRRQRPTCWPVTRWPSSAESPASTCSSRDRLRLPQEDARRRTLTMFHELPLSRWISAISGNFSMAEVFGRQRQADLITC
jgi:hypothetical protein